MAEKIILKDNAQSVDLEIKDASVGPSVIDLKSLYSDTGYFTFDPSYSTTASCESKITYIDGAKGIFCLLYTSPSPRDRTRSRMPSSA